MARKVNVEVALSGESKYKQAISELNAANKTLGAEMNRLSAEFKGNSDSVDFLSQRGDVLRDMLLKQQEKVAQLKEAVKYASQEYGEASTRTQGYAAQLANAEASSLKLQRAIEENNKAIQQQAHSTVEYDEQLKVLRSELNEVDSEIRVQGETAENLSKKHDTLNAILEEQKKKYDTLVEALKEAKESENASKEEIRQLTIKVNEAATAYNNTSSAISENEKRLNEHAKAVDNDKDKLAGIGDTINGVTEKFGVRLPDGAKKALNGMNSFSAGTVKAMTAAAAAVATVVKVTKQLHELAVQYAAEADDIITKSAITGLSTTLLQELQYAEPLIDVSVETITGSMTKLTRNMSSAALGNEKLSKSFEELGVTITNQDGSLRGAQEVFFELIDALGQVGNETERDALSMELFGKSAQELNPLIKQGTGVLQEYMRAAHENYVLTEDQIKALGELDDQVQSNSLQWEGLKKQIASQFAPASKEALEDFGKLVKNAGEALVNSGIIKGTGEILANLTALLEPFSSFLGLASNAQQQLGPLYTVLHSIAGVLAWIADAANAVYALLEMISIVNFKDGWNRWSTAMGAGAAYGNYSNMQQWMGYSNDVSGNYYDPNTGLYTGNYFAGNAGGTDSWRGGLTWVGEAGPELVSLPQGSKIMNAQESRNVAAGTTNYYINVENVDELDQIINWYNRRKIYDRMGVYEWQ